MAVTGFGTKVCDRTTLKDLKMLRLTHGIERIVVDYDYIGERLHNVYVTMFTNEFRSRGSGADETAAFDDAFQRLVHRVGEACVDSLALTPPDDP